MAYMSFVSLKLFGTSQNNINQGKMASFSPESGKNIFYWWKSGKNRCFWNKIREKISSSALLDTLYQQYLTNFCSVPSSENNFWEITREISRKSMIIEYIKQPRGSRYSKLEANSRVSRSRLEKDLSLLWRYLWNQEKFATRRWPNHIR